VNTYFLPMVSKLTFCGSAGIGKMSDKTSSISGSLGPVAVLGFESVIAGAGGLASWPPRHRRVNAFIGVLLGWEDGDLDNERWVFGLYWRSISQMS